MERARCPMVVRTLLVGACAWMVSVGCDGTRCGAGTVAVDGFCVPDVADPDGGRLDGATTLDSSVDSDAAIPEITEVELVVRYPWASHNGRDPVVPVGGIVEIAARGLTTSRDWVPLPASALRTEGGSVVGRRREPLGEQPSRLSVVGTEPGTARVIASVTTSHGVREAELFVVVETPVEPLTLACVSSQDYPDVFRDIATIDGRFEGAAVLAVDLPARVLCHLEWAGLGRQVRQPLAAEDYSVAVSSGPGRVEDRSVVRGTAPGTVDLLATYTPEGASVAAPTDAVQVRFVDEVPATSLGLGLESVRSTAAPSATPTAPAWDNGSNVVYLHPGTSIDLEVLSWHSVSATERYFRRVPFSDVTARVVPSGTELDLDADGRLTWREGGVVGLSLAARGFEISRLVASPYPAGTEVVLRAVPDSVALAVTSRSQVCARLQMFVSIDGVERPMTDLETRAIRRSPSPEETFLHWLIDPTDPTDPTELCLDFAQRFLGEPATWTADHLVMWIQAPNDFNQALRVPVAITWLD